MNDHETKGLERLRRAVINGSAQGEHGMTTETTTGHTPIPWAVMPFTRDGSWGIHRKTPTLDGGYFANVEPLKLDRYGRDQAEANARMIVLAVNSHAALLAALRGLRNYHDNDPDLYDGDDDGVLGRLMNNATDAIVNATPKESTV